MSSIGELFRTPGASLFAGELRREATRAHAALFFRAVGDNQFLPQLRTIRDFLEGTASPGERHRLLCHPLFVNGLHELAACCPALETWRHRVQPQPAPVESILGEVALALALRLDHQWQGEVFLRTDPLGRLRFPFSDWSLALESAEGVLAGRTIRVSTDQTELHWTLVERPDDAFLSLSRRAARQMFVDNAEDLTRAEIRAARDSVRTRLQRSRRLGSSPVRYEPVAFIDFDAHAGLTGGLLERLLQGLARNSPGVHDEFTALMHTVRGFELPHYAFGTVQSFSDPTLPGVMGFNANYTPEGDLQLDPFCFTWLGHELGHTRNYLIDNVLYARGEALVLNRDDSAGHVPRYERSITIRTLFQIPYVHFYEWAVLLDFARHGFAGLPWTIDGDWPAFGQGLAAEIEEAFERIADQARLTPLGQEAVEHFHALHAGLRAQWHSVTSHACR